MFEYNIMETDQPTASAEQLEGFGNDGWELVQIVLWNDRAYYYFKRLKAAKQ